MERFAFTSSWTPPVRSSMSHTKRSYNIFGLHRHSSPSAESSISQIPSRTTSQTMAPSVLGPQYSTPNTGSWMSRPLTRNSASRAQSVAPGRRSRANSIVNGEESHDVICAICEGRGVMPSVGVCFVNIGTGEITMSQICDSQFYVKTLHKVRVYDPAYILICSTLCPPHGQSGLYSALVEHQVGLKLVPGERGIWNESTGLDYIDRLAFKEDVAAIKVAIQGNYYATCSLAAAIKYLEREWNLRVTPHSLRIRYQPSEDAMMIDISAVESLELIRNIRDPKSKNSLYGLLNNTLTPMGARILRSNILQPSTLVSETIIPRFKTLEELTSKEEMFSEIRSALRRFQDVEKLLTKIIFKVPKIGMHTSEQALNNILMIKQFLESVPDIYRALTPATSSLLLMIRSTCCPDITNPILDKVLESIEADVTFAKSPVEIRNQRAFAVKSGINGLLDVARRTFQEGQSDVHDHHENIKNSTGLNIALKYDNGRKYYFSFREEELGNNPVPDSFINVVKKRQVIQCQTLRLVQLNQRVKDSEDEIIIQSDEVVLILMYYIQSQVPRLFRICESIALLDMMASFGQLVILRDYKMPMMGDRVAVKGAKHPLMDVVISNFVPNDYYSSEDYHFHVVTGCNMSGKSTYIRTIALLQIMAQIGCFIPADWASLPVISSIFARVSTDDSIEANMSTFSVEMREMAFILRNMDRNSLAIIDELGRGTSTQDGLAIAVAMAESLVKTKATVWFATHFIELGEALQDKPGVLNLHLATHTEEGDTPSTTMLYKIESGVVTDEHYGVLLARALGFPARFIEFAEEIVADIERRREGSRRGRDGSNIIVGRRLTMNLYESLKQAQASNLENDKLWEYLMGIQTEYSERMIELTVGDNDGEGGAGGEQAEVFDEKYEEDKWEDGELEEILERTSSVTRG